MELPCQFTQLNEFVSSTLPLTSGTYKSYVSSRSLFLKLASIFVASSQYFNSSSFGTLNYLHLFFEFNYYFNLIQAIFRCFNCTYFSLFFSIFLHFEQSQKYIFLSIFFAAASIVLAGCCFQHSYPCSALCQTAWAKNRSQAQAVDCGCPTLCCCC